jgi:hypothetical protein
MGGIGFMNMDKFQKIGTKDYIDLSTAERELIGPFLETSEVCEMLKLCYASLEDEDRNPTEEQQRINFCRNFDINTIQNQDGSSRTFVTFDILRPGMHDRKGNLFCNETAEIVQDSNYLRMIYVRTYASFPECREIYIENKGKLTHNHTVDWIMPKDAKRRIKADDYVVVKYLTALGRRRAERCILTYNELLKCTKVNKGISRKLKSHR